MSFTRSQKRNQRWRRLRQKRIERDRAKLRRRIERRNDALGIKTQASVARSLDDLLPDADAYSVGPDGKVTLNMKCKRGAEEALLADIAKRLNVPVDALEHTTTKKGTADEP